jgi:hypothetical protein
MNNVIHLVNSGCGNLGKSLFSSILIEYYLHRSKPYQLIDLDIDNPDVQLRYESLGSSISGIYLTMNKADEVSDAILDSLLASDLILNLPPNNFDLLKTWHERNPTDDIIFVHWFLCDGSAKSSKYFKCLVDEFPQHRIIPVHNFFMGIYPPDSNYSTLIHLPKIQVDKPDLALIEQQPNIPYSQLPFTLKGKSRWENFTSIFFRKLDLVLNVQG